jgi:hypothetical protein
VNHPGRPELFVPPREKATSVGKPRSSEHRHRPRAAHGETSPSLARPSRNQEGCRGSRPQTPGPRSGLPWPRFFLEPGVWSLESLPPCARFRVEGTMRLRRTGRGEETNRPG